MAEFIAQGHRHREHTSTAIKEGSRELTLQYRMELYVVGGRVLGAQRKQTLAALAWSMNSFLSDDPFIPGWVGSYDGLMLLWEVSYLL